MKLLNKTSLIVLLLAACTWGCSDDELSCEIIANAQSDNFLKVVNKSSSKIQVDFGTLPFSAEMRLNACELTGLPVGDHYVEISKCEGPAGNCNSLGSVKRVDFILDQGETYTITVTDSFF